MSSIGFALNVGRQELIKVTERDGWVPSAALYSILCIDKWLYTPNTMLTSCKCHSLTQNTTRLIPASVEVMPSLQLLSCTVRRRFATIMLCRKLHNNPLCVPDLKVWRACPGRKENVFGTYDTGFSHKITRLGIVCVQIYKVCRWSVLTLNFAEKFNVYKGVLVIPDQQFKRFLVCR